MTSGRGRRVAGGAAIVLALGLLFWLTAVLTSVLPDSQVVAVNLHGLTVDPVGGTQRPAPLSLSVLLDAQQDGSNAPATAGPAPTPSPLRSTPSAAATPGVPSPPATTPSPTSPLPTPSLSPLPTPTSPLPSPSPTGSATIAGQVSDSSTGNAIPGATVSLSPGGASALTDANGNFSFTVAPGSYTVNVSAATYNSVSQSVTVKSGQRAALVIKLTSVTAYGSITGYVVDAATSTPIVGATVRLSNGLVRVTDANGYFSYSIVLNGSYTLTASAVGYVTQSQAVTVKPGHTTKVLFGLSH